ncbi:cyclin-dependent kinase inhibitor 7-like [Lycium ferocissimum]|uniref:cyclin-dependent kinase inhibitor 7-like n=1 Tax=Lycium ferocissimum TaxID=112874 RepID=UPI0028168E28|nr:cyclin-dependent kinase inhibitor 7-like [Lycium ferocissimum]
MENYLRKCEKIRRDNDVEVTSSLSSSTKRRKFGSANFSDNSTSPATSVTSVNIPMNYSLCSSNCKESGEVMKSIFKSLDLKLQAEGFETDNSASFNGAFSESFKQIEHCGNSEEMESSSTTTKKSTSAVNAHRKLPSAAAKIPPEAEIEEFFAAAEKREEKRFAEKYNYDIVKDVPLEGRYQWVSLKP